MLTVRIVACRIKIRHATLIRLAQKPHRLLIAHPLYRQRAEAVLVCYNSGFSKSYCLHSISSFLFHSYLVTK